MDFVVLADSAGVVAHVLSAVQGVCTGLLRQRQVAEGMVPPVRRPSRSLATHERIHACVDAVRSADCVATGFVMWLAQPQGRAIMIISGIRMIIRNITMITLCIIIIRMRIIMMISCIIMIVTGIRMIIRGIILIV